MNIQIEKTVAERLHTYLADLLIYSAIAAVAYLIVSFVWWYSYKPMNQLPDELANMSMEDSGLEENLILYFDASSNSAEGQWGADGNYLLTLNTVSGDLDIERLPAKGMQHEVHWNGYTSHYAMTPLNTWGQRYQFYYAGIPIATGGHYVVRDESGKRVDTMRDPQGMDLHDFVITPDGNYLYLGAHITEMYPDRTLTCLPQCGNLWQSVVEVTPEGNELYRYHLSDYYERDDFVMDDMLTRGNWNLYDLTHANSARLTPDGTGVIVSVRHTNEVIVIDRATGDIQWRSRDYTFVDDSLNGFSHQHDAQILDNGNLLLFDNGNDRGQLSRAVEYAVDHDAKTLTLVWEYTNGQYQPNRGSVRRTPAGNSIINFVDMDSDDVVIVSPDNDVLFSITIPSPYAPYRVGFEVIEYVSEDD